eukprot:m51a1_g12902 hypothetical protein (199) ;mRNA; r:2142-2799
MPRLRLAPLLGPRARHLRRYDRCGECGGQDRCVGCDGTPWSGLELDRCGQCGGQNLCVGCDNRTYLDDEVRPELDECGVCGGNSTCIGCDGVPFSGARKDACGDCGGNVTEKHKCPKDMTAVTIGVTAAGSIIGVTLVAVALGIVGFFAFKAWRNGANWYIPNALLQDEAEAVQSNPTYERDKDAGFQINPLADEARE